MRNNFDEAWYTLVDKITNLCLLMFSRAYGDARMPNWPHRHRTPLPGIATSGLRRDNGGNLYLQKKFCNCSQTS